MIMYMTTETLDTNGKSVIVYAVVFTSIDNGDNWYQLTQIIEGKANVAGYSYTGGVNYGSIDTDSWRDLNGNTISTCVQNNLYPYTK